MCIQGRQSSGPSVKKPSPWQSQFNVDLQQLYYNTKDMRLFRSSYDPFPRQTTDTNTKNRINNNTSKTTWCKYDNDRFQTWVGTGWLNLGITPRHTGVAITGPPGSIYWNVRGRLSLRDFAVRLRRKAALGALRPIFLVRTTLLFTSLLVANRL